jgi:hypothetical protein
MCKILGSIQKKQRKKEGRKGKRKMQRKVLKANSSPGCVPKLVRGCPWQKRVRGRLGIPGDVISFPHSHTGIALFLVLAVLWPHRSLPNVVMTTDIHIGLSFFSKFCFQLGW